nr:hypothetical protein [Nocardia wallacei]
MNRALEAVGAQSGGEVLGRDHHRVGSAGVPDDGAPGVPGGARLVVARDRRGIAQEQPVQGPHGHRTEIRCGRGVFDEGVVAAVYRLHERQAVAAGGPHAQDARAVGGVDVDHIDRLVRGEFRIDEPIVGLGRYDHRVTVHAYARQAGQRSDIRIGGRRSGTGEQRDTMPEPSQGAAL